MIIAALYPSPFTENLFHDANAAIVTDDAVYAYEEGKLTGIKNDGTVQFAERSLLMGFKELGIAPSDVDAWVLPKTTSPVNPDRAFRFFSFFLKAHEGAREDFDEWYARSVSEVDHHEAHIGLAVHASGFEDCAFLSMDGGGDDADNHCMVWGEYINSNHEIRGRQAGWAGLGSFHDFVSEALGYAPFENGKTSGLAAYGTPQADLVERMATLLEPDGAAIKFTRERFERTAINPERAKPQEYDRSKALRRYPVDTNVMRMVLPYLPHDIAASCEAVLRQYVLKVIASIREQSSMKNIVLSGGLFQNVAVNKAVIESGLFDNYYFPMACGDGGLSLGAAYFVHGRADRGPHSPYLGPSFSPDDIESTLTRYRIQYEETSDPARTAAEFVSEGEIVGWFQGRGEYGPRSLGARSILADPRTMSSKERVNQLLKKRDWFMPYAPAIMNEHFGEWFSPDFPAHYMEVALNVHDDKKHLVPAAVHVDGTSRAQRVFKNEAPLFWSLLDHFRELTGIPAVLNTSFNRHGISTISSPSQAIEHLLFGCMDHLIIDRFVVSFARNRLAGELAETPVSEDEMLAQACIDRLQHVEKYASDAQRDKYNENLRAFMAARQPAMSDAK